MLKLLRFALLLTLLMALLAACDPDEEGAIPDTTVDNVVEDEILEDDEDEAGIEDGGGDREEDVGDADDPNLAPEPGPPPFPARTIFVHLFEWLWTDIAQECENFLGPAGYAAVQVSPPQEHLLASGYPWWQRYQPVSYQIESRSGTREEFADMVARCDAVGVDIYVDAVINHMSGMGSGIGSAGTRFTHFDYPGLYDYEDFHHCGITPNDDIVNYNDPEQVRTCELLNLADLNTGSEEVRDTIAAYLNDLISLGVAGFRIDAAKHMAPEDIAAIVSRLDGEPYIYQEVIDVAREPIQAEEYTFIGDVTEFNYGFRLARAFSGGNLAGLRDLNESTLLLPSTEAVVFVDNHDNQRGHGAGGNVITHKTPELYRLAQIFTLSYPYGYPRVMSSYPFVDTDAGPPGEGPDTDPVYDGADDGPDPDCFEEWVCEHRWPAIAGMVGFHNFTAPNFFVSDWWSNNRDQIAFGRGELGFVVINASDQPLQRTFQTSLPAGAYCNVVEAGVDALAAYGGECAGTVFEVDGAGQMALEVAPMDAVAFHIGAHLPAE